MWSGYDVADNLNISPIKNGNWFMLTSYKKLKNNNNKQTNKNTNCVNIRHNLITEMMDFIWIYPDYIPFNND